MYIKINVSKNIKRMLLIIICKMIYDICVLRMLPKTYLGGMTHGLDYNSFKHFVGFLVFLLISEYTLLLVDYFGENNNTLLLKILFHLYYLPLNSSFYLNNTSFIFLTFTTLFWVSFVFFVSKNSGQNNVDINNYKTIVLDNNKYLTLFFIIVCLSCLAYAYKYNGLNIWVSFGELYDIRAKYSGTSSMLESVIFNFGGSLMVSLGMLYSMNNKKIFLFILSVVSQIAVFSIAGSKSQLFTIVLVIAIFFANKLKLLKRNSEYVVVGFIALMSLSLIEHYVMNSEIIFYIIVRRMMYVPAWMNTFYYDFFSDNKLLMWSQDIFLIDHLGIGRYDKSILEILDYKYFAGLMPSPNAGLFAEAFMHWGYIGVLIYPIFMSMVIKWLFKYVNYYSLDIQILFVCEVALSLSNVPLVSGVFCVTYLFFIPFTYIVKKMK